MANARDVADYILEKMGPMSAMKLQKLVYYAQAWALVWNDRELFPEEIEAWVSGPVVRELYDAHRGRFRLSRGFFKGDPKKLTREQRKIVDRVLDFYGEKNAQWLSDLTHMEDPWRKARSGLADRERGDRVISKAEMAEYYGSLIAR